MVLKKMKKISILFLLCSCLFCACKKKNISLEGETIVMNLGYAEESIAYQLHFTSSSEFTYTLRSLYDGSEYEHAYGTYSYNKDKLSLSLLGDNYEVVCETKTNKKSSLEGTKWKVTCNNNVAIIELQSTAYNYKGGKDNTRGVYNYDGLTLSFVDADDYYRYGYTYAYKVSCGSLLYDMAKK